MRPVTSGTGIVKRSLDLCGASLLLILFSPFLVLAAAAILVRMGSPVLFVQQRPGLGGKPFAMMKFRTMRDARDRAGRDLPDGERLTPLGAFLRSSSIDELPGLWNVIRGDMSLVGPRPLLMEYLPLYSAGQARRHLVRPGLSGWAQVNGRNGLSWEEKFALDVWYVDNRDTWLDLRILCLTVARVLRRDGVSAPGEATMAKFVGSRADS